LSPPAWFLVSALTANYTVAGTRQVAIVTGAGSGIGVETARALATAGARVVLAVRDATKVKSVVEDIVKTSKNNKVCPCSSLLACSNPLRLVPTGLLVQRQVDAMSLDLGDLKSVAAFAVAFRKRKLGLNLLINNVTPER
jgi:NAD(P)-dependent dehydrogenase (short-subunit alcohol dehydrogenase family)